MLVRYRDDFGQDCPPCFNDKLGLELIFSGCKRAMQGRACSGCHSKALWSFDEVQVGVKALNLLKAHLKKITERGRNLGDMYSYVTFMGGEPFDQDFNHLSQVADVIRDMAPAMPLVVFTGYENLTVLPNTSVMFMHKYANFVKFGEYDEKDLNNSVGKPGTHLASRNQYFMEIIRKANNHYTFKRL